MELNTYLVIVILILLAFSTLINYDLATADEGFSTFPEFLTSYFRPNKVHKEHYNGTLPGFIITGVMKCGTGAVSKFLSQHSGIYDIGETYFFNRYYEKGYSYYDALLTRRSSGKRKIVFEKTPTYYKTLPTAERIYAMNPETKIILIVCDNVQRTLSRYLHILHLNPSAIQRQQKEEKIEDLGQDFDEFQTRLNMTVDELNIEFEWMLAKRFGNFYRFVEDLYDLFNQRKHPFATKESNLKELILTDGFYSIYHMTYLKMFEPERVLVVDGSTMKDSPWTELYRIQKFLEVPVELTKDSFKWSEERGLYCLDKGGDVNCLGKGKGRSQGWQFEPYLQEKLADFFRPFDSHFADLVKRKFSWQSNKNDVDI
ncbi:unnamed protein product [Oikopleura dioica]|uniref:Sulfotransferase n=1 Tax=Oikopleura dioica TaxID=34765 RepID=E4XE56_OIKDI|nr:unnamed protein product [Oikopleura dioica]